MKMTSSSLHVKKKKKQVCLLFAWSPRVLNATVCDCLSPRLCETERSRPCLNNTSTFNYHFHNFWQFDTRTRTGTERTDEVSMGNHDTVKELGSLVQRAQLRAGVKSNRGSGNCADSRTHSFTSAMEKQFLRHNPSTIVHSEGTLQTTASNPDKEQPETRQAKAPSLSMKCSLREPRMRWDHVQRQIAGTMASILLM